MIDKIQPRKLDKDTDQKLVQKTSMIDALNIYVDENLVGTEAGAGVKACSGDRCAFFYRWV